ncbi:MAG TPA: YheC/YheD family protein [Bacillota bacterium]
MTRGSAKPVLLGVFTATGPDDRRRLGAQTIDYAELARVGRPRGVRVVVFRPQDVASDHRVRGYVYDGGRRRWRRAQTPWPQIVYNRVPRRSFEQRPDVQDVLQRFRRAGVPVFNPGFLNKWTIYEILTGDPRTAGFIPPTQRVRSLDDVLRALDTWRAVYLKPVEGSLGRGIIYVTRRQGGFACHGFLGHRYRRGWVARWSDMERLLAYPLSRKEYVVQAAIRRSRLRGRPFDVRCLVQKGGDGAWRVVGMAARVAAPGRVLTHVPRGGERLNLRQALGESFPRQLRQDIPGRLHAAALAAAHAIDDHYQGLFAELSVDLTLDRSGRPWILECNAKPSRFDEYGIRRRQLHHVVDFARETVRRLENGRSS